MSSVVRTPHPTELSKETVSFIFNAAILNPEELQTSSQVSAIKHNFGLFLEASMGVFGNHQTTFWYLEKNPLDNVSSTTKATVQFSIFWPQGIDGASIRVLSHGEMAIFKPNLGNYSQFSLIPLNQSMQIPGALFQRIRRNDFNQPIGWELRIKTFPNVSLLWREMMISASLSLDNPAYSDPFPTDQNSGQGSDLGFSLTGQGLDFPSSSTGQGSALGFPLTGQGLDFPSSSTGQGLSSIDPEE